MICRRCDICKKDTGHTSSSKMCSAPEALVVNISRFSTASGAATKLTEHVAFDRVLILPTEAGTSNKPISYKLYSVLVHEGHTPDDGHYVAYVRNLPGDQWLCCNDSTVSVTTWQHVQQQKAYILMYEKDAHAGAMGEFYRQKISENTEAMQEYIQGEVPIKELCFYEGAVSAMLSTYPQQRVLDVYRPRILGRAPGDNPFAYPLLCAYGLAELLQHQGGTSTGKAVDIKSVTTPAHFFVIQLNIIGIQESIECKNLCLTSEYANEF